VRPERFLKLDYLPGTRLGVVVTPALVGCGVGWWTFIDADADAVAVAVAVLTCVAAVDVPRYRRAKRQPH
jgi:uncharacterized membrane protein YfcA